MAEIANLYLFIYTCVYVIHKCPEHTHKQTINRQPCRMPKHISHNHIIRSTHTVTQHTHSERERVKGVMRQWRHNHAVCIPFNSKCVYVKRIIILQKLNEDGTTLRCAI